MLDTMHYNLKVAHLDHFLNLYNDLVQIEDIETSGTVKKWIEEEFKNLYNQNPELDGIEMRNIVLMIKINNEFDIIPIEKLLKNVDF